MAVKPMPEGYATITPSLTVDGADKAIDFYKRALGAEERFRMNRPDGKVAHAEIQIGTSVVMLGEASPEHGCTSPRTLGGTPVGFYIYVQDVDTAIKRAISAGGKETMPVQDMFWGDRMGSFDDPFGHKWSLATHVRDLTPEQIEKGQAEFFAEMAKKKAK